jgi:pimeloyl-ACP methyl ester carboxylesterase
MGFGEHAPWALSALLRLSLASLASADDLSHYLRGLHVPTRIVVGGDDAAAMGACLTLSSLIPGATLTVLEGAGHVVNLARASLFNEELRQLIAEVTWGNGMESSK